MGKFVEDFKRFLAPLAVVEDLKRQKPQSHPHGAIFRCKERELFICSPGTFKERELFICSPGTFIGEGMEYVGHYEEDTKQLARPTSNRPERRTMKKFAADSIDGRFLLCGNHDLCKTGIPDGDIYLRDQHDTIGQLWGDLKDRPELTPERAAQIRDYAHLITAAPDLLDACKCALADLEGIVQVKYSSERLPIHPDDPAHTTIKELKTTIDKAEGRY